MSAQMAHGLFCLVLLKLIVPVPAAWFWWPSVERALPTAARFTAWVRQDEAPPAAVATPTAPVSVPVPMPLPAQIELPTTGDVGASLADVSNPQPTVIVAPPAPPERTVPATAPPLAGASVSVLSLQAMLMLGWSLIVVLLLVRFHRAILMTRRMVRDAVPLSPDCLPIDVDSLGRAVGLRGSVRWVVNFDLNSPAVAGLVHPAVVLPPDLSDSLTPKQLSWVLLHELAHVRRGDLWVVVGQRVLQAFFFFHPAVHLANWLIDELREYACDDAALAASKTSRHVCGEGFLAIVERSVERSPVARPALGLFESRLLIRRRLIRILDEGRQVHARLSPRAAFGLLFLALLLLPFGWPRDVKAFPHDGASPPMDRISPAAAATPLPVGPREPASFRPGVIWHAEGRREARAEAGRGAVQQDGAAVLALAYSPDGSIMASAGDDAVVLLRNVDSGRLVGRLQGHGDAIACLAFSPDGKTLATGSYDRTIKLWDVSSGRAKQTLIGHTNWVFSVAFSPDGALLASAGHDKMVRLWDLASGRETAALAGHSASVRAVAFAPSKSARLLASAGADREVALWNLRDLSVRAVSRGTRGPFAQSRLRLTGPHLRPEARMAR